MGDRKRDKKDEQTERTERTKWEKRISNLEVNRIFLLCFLFYHHAGHISFGLFDLETNKNTYRDKRISSSSQIVARRTEAIRQKKKKKGEGEDCVRPHENCRLMDWRRL
jgi:hypothetical protein